MNIEKFDDYFSKHLKSLKEDESQRVAHYLDKLSDEKIQFIMAIGEKFHKSSAVNGTWFWRTVPVLAEHLQETEMSLWLEEGERICRGSWECSLSFLKASAEVLDNTSPEIFLKWVQIGRILVRFSNNEATWIFKHGEKVLGKADYFTQRLLTNWVLKIIEHSWEAAVACFKTWPAISVHVEKENAEKLLISGLKLSSLYPDDASAYFEALPGFLQRFGLGLTYRWIENALEIKNGKRGVLASFFKATPLLPQGVSKNEFERNVVIWASYGNQLASIDSKIAEAFFEASPQILKNIEWQDLEEVVRFARLINDSYSAQGTLEFVKSISELLLQLDVKELANWIEHGLSATKGEKRQAYFTLKSQDSRDAISRFRTGLHLEAAKKVLSLYCEGLTGEMAIFRNASELPPKIHGDERVFGTLDTRRVYLPDVIKLYENDSDNLRFYRAMLMHLLAHKEFGTLSLAQEDFRELHSNKYLGLLFELIEGNRVDYLAMQNYQGLSKDFQWLVASAADKTLETSEDFELWDYLRYYLWKDAAKTNDLIPFEIITELDEFWISVTSTGASVEASLTTARKVLAIIKRDDHVGKQPPLIENLKYRGKLKYDLIYTARSVDEELGQASDQPRKQSLSDSVDEKDKFNDSGFHFDDANLHNEFYVWLKKRLHGFIEDEENPYRMIAYYDEWDRTLNDYKKDWCKVREILLNPSSGKLVNQILSENSGMINTLKRYFGMLRPDRFRRYHRQEDGEEVDIDAVVEAMIGIKAGVTSTDGFYIRRDKKERDVAVGFLLDLSYSTEEVVSESGKTILDVEKESVIVISEALEVLGDKFAIYGFNSDGRDKVNFYVVKDFEEAYSEKVKQRYGGFQSFGMTRLASGIRHAVNKMEKIQAAIKILFVVTDGRPFDFDYNSGLSKDYEHLYPETDTRMALRESKMKGINPFCITVDKKGQEYMEYIFGNVSYIIIDDVNLLPTKLTETYKNLTT